jgi:hypothetical protein
LSASAVHELIVMDATCRFGKSIEIGCGFHKCASSAATCNRLSSVAEVDAKVHARTIS